MHVLGKLMHCKHARTLTKWMLYRVRISRQPTVKIIQLTNKNIHSEVSQPRRKRTCYTSPYRSASHGSNEIRHRPIKTPTLHNQFIIEWGNSHSVLFKFEEELFCQFDWTNEDYSSENHFNSAPYVLEFMWKLYKKPEYSYFPSFWGYFVYRALCIKNRRLLTHKLVLRIQLRSR